MPDFFVEVPDGLAAEKGIANGERVRVWSPRGEVEGVAIVTKRIKPLTVNGRTLWTIGIPGPLGIQGDHDRLHGELAHAVRRRRQHELSRVQGVPGEHGARLMVDIPGNGLAIKRISASPDPAPGIRRGPEYAKLVDISRCIGCKGCEVACKECNELGIEPTRNFGSFQSQQDLTPRHLAPHALQRGRGRG